MPEFSFHFRPATSQEIEITSKSLLEHSRQALGFDVTHKPFGLLVYRDGKLAGSVIGKIFFNWLHIDLIWVDIPYRGSGLGTRLMQQTLQKATGEGLDGIEVWTQSWQAPEFYRKLGYEEFAVLEDFGPGRKRHAFRHYIVNSARVAGNQTLPEIIREHVKAYFNRHGDTLPSPGIYDRLMPLFEKPLIEVTLEATGGNQLRAAHLLGMNRNTLRKKITGLGIKL